jgi:hypothetical protein
MPPRAKVDVDIGVKGRKAMSQIKTLAGRVNKAFSKIKPIAGLALGAGGAFALQSAIKRTVDFDVALTRLAIQAKLTSKEQAALRAEMIGVAESSGIAKDQILAAGQSIIDATGDAEFMREVLGEVATMSQVTGADMAGMGNIVADLKNNFNLTGKEASQMLRVITEQGEQGKFTLVEFAQEGSKAFSAMALAGLKTEEQIKNATAELQVMRRGFSTASETTTAYLSLVRRLAMQSEKLGKKGVRVFADQEKTTMRSMSDILTDIFTNIGQNTDVLSELFGESVAGVQAFSTAFDEAKKEGKDLKSVIGDFNTVTGDSARFQKDLGRIMDTTGGKMLTFQQKLDKIFDEAFMENVDDLAGYLPEFTKLIKFLAEHKEEIIAIWTLSKLGAVPGLGGAPLVGGKVPAGPGKVPLPTAPQAPGGGLLKTGLGAVIPMAGAGLAAGQAGFQAAESTIAQGQYEKALQSVLGRKVGLFESLKLMFATMRGGIGPGAGEFEPATKEELTRIFGAEMKDRFGDLEKALQNMKLEANVTVNAPSPLSQPGGTQPTTKTGATQ